MYSCLETSIAKLSSIRLPWQIRGYQDDTQILHQIRSTAYTFQCIHCTFHKRSGTRHPYFLRGVQRIPKVPWKGIGTMRQSAKLEELASGWCRQRVCRRCIWYGHQATSFPEVGLYLPGNSLSFQDPDRCPGGLCFRSQGSPKMIWIQKFRSQGTMPAEISKPTQPGSAEYIEEDVTTRLSL